MATKCSSTFDFASCIVAFELISHIKKHDCKIYCCTQVIKDMDINDNINQNKSAWIHYPDSQEKSRERCKRYWIGVITFTGIHSHPNSVSSVYESCQILEWISEKDD